MAVLWPDGDIATHATEVYAAALGGDHLEAVREDKDGWRFVAFNLGQTCHAGPETHRSSAKTGIAADGFKLGHSKIGQYRCPDENGRETNTVL